MRIDHAVTSGRSQMNAAFALEVLDKAPYITVSVTTAYYRRGLWSPGLRAGN